MFCFYFVYSKKMLYLCTCKVERLMYRGIMKHKSNSTAERAGNYIYVANKTSDARPWLTQSGFYVQDYNCAVARQQRRSAWFMRLYIFMKTHPDYSALMCTLTYNDKCIPSYNCKLNVFGHGKINPGKSDYCADCIPCFSREDIQKFHKRVRKQLPACALKYMVCSEYGSRYSKRSHYHAVYFVRNTDLNVLASVLKEKWTFGNVYISKNVAGTYDIKDSNALFYVSKYITKDMYFLDDKRYKMLDWIGRDEFNKKYAPFHFQSTNLAGDWYKHCKDVWDILVNGFKVETLHNGCIETNRKPLPSYCVDRLFCKHIYMKEVQDDGSVKCVHRKVVKHKMLKSFIEYKFSVLENKVSDIKLNYPHLMSILSVPVETVLLWGAVRGTLVNPLSPVKVVDLVNTLTDEIPSYDVLKDVFRGILLWSDRERADMNYISDFNAVQHLIDIGWIPLCCLGVGAYLDEQYIKYLKYVSDQQEKCQIVLDDIAERIKFARESTANHSVQ